MTWAPDYCEVTDLAEFMRISDDADNAALGRAITAASRAIDQAAGRQFGKVAAPEARYYTAAYDHRRCRWFADIDDLMTTAGMLVDYDNADDGTYTSSVDDGLLLPPNAVAKGRPWTRLEVRPGAAVSVGPVLDGVRVTATWGWSAVPGPVVEAALMQASRLMARRDSPYGIAGTGDQTPGLRILSKVDPDVEVLLRPYLRMWGAV